MEARPDREASEVSVCVQEAATVERGNGCYVC